MKNSPTIDKYFEVLFNSWGTMTNPVNKKTKDEFISQIPTHLGIEIIGDYINTDTKIEYRCCHGTYFSRPWQILKFKHCCRKGYYKSGKMWASQTVPPDERLTWYKQQRPTLLFKEAQLVPGSRNKFDNIKCSIHPEVSFQGKSTKQHCTPCPICKVEDFKALMVLRVGTFHANHKITPVSKSEKQWLDKLNVPERQYWLPEVKYRVDGYDPETRTVYLYHGKFWHGCPETFDPEMIHPIVKIPMKDLYEKTMFYESKIKEAGYNLITKWGT
jgi:hypothetical protein